MSLTSHLKDKASPLRAWFESSLPDKRRFLTWWRERTAGLETYKPKGVGGGYPWSLVGTAADLRLRLALRAVPPVSLVAVGEGGNVWTYWPGGDAILFGDEMASLCERWEGRPYLRGLADHEERELARLCLALAWFETYKRTWRVPPEISAAGSMSEMLLATPYADVALDDLIDLERLFERLRQEWPSPDEVVLGPTFDGSPDVGGADADAVIGRHLWDFKCTTAPGRVGDAFWPYQLLGYVFLDYADRYRLESVGVYLVRQGTWFSWRVQELIRLLGGDPRLPLEEWRVRFREAAAAVRSGSGELRGATVRREADGRRHVRWKEVLAWVGSLFKLRPMRQ
ncbi:MAG: hypothetical protein RMK67_02825 [Chloroflexota bacterium]|jgi:hypothetical protein|nr:hypothetical protein [Chloroflexota bacterium]